MGKFRTRTKGKGKRWRKGHSSSSNPETQKHRIAAKSRFFSENLGGSNLTTEALQKHDTFLGTQPMNEDDFDETSCIGIPVRTSKTFQTFASNWSNCSNMSFNRLLTRFNSNSALHKEMLAVLAAVTEVIKSNGGEETSTEYFGALITTLEACDNEDSVAAVLSLLGMGIKTVPENVLRLKFSEASKTFVDILSKFATSENNAILRALIGCLSVLLRVQDMSVWSNASTLQVFDTVLAFTIHSKPKIRKAAQHAVCAILKGSVIMTGENKPSHHPAANHAAKFCVHQMETGGTLGGTTTTLHILYLVKEILGTFSKSYVKQTCECILKVMTLGNILVLSCGMQALHGLFLSRPSVSCLPASLNARLVSALFNYQPAATDQQPILAWLAVMQEAYINLGRLDLNLWSGNLPRLFSDVTKLWLTEKSEIMSNATKTLKHVVESSLSDVIQPDVIHQYKSTISTIIRSVEAGLQYQFHSAWPYVIDLFGILFKIAGGACYDLLGPCLKSLVELRDTEQFSYKNELEEALGGAVRSMGPEKFLAVVPLQISEQDTNGNIERSWLLPILKKYIQNAPLQFFVTYFLPLATMCRRKVQSLESTDKIAAHVYDLLQSQIWSLLPSFCNNTPDVKESFKGIAKIMGIVISEYKDIRIPVMASLRTLITQNQQNNNEDNLSELRKFAKNYLPILFNVYTTKPKGSDERGHRSASFDTIKVYLTIANEELCKELFNRGFNKLTNKEEVDDFIKQSVLDLLRSLLQYQDEAELLKLCNLIEKYINDKKMHQYQKKAYRLLEEMCASNSSNCRSFLTNHMASVQDLLLKSLSSASASSKGPRLRCLIHLVQQMEKCEMEFLLKIIPEAVLCCKDINEKCRSSAFSLVSHIGVAMERSLDMSKTEVFKKYLSLLMAGLGGSPTLMSATLLALAAVTNDFKDHITPELLQLMLENVTILVNTPTREIVASALSYITFFITSFPVERVGPFVPTIMKSLINMTDDNKRHFRQKCRDIFSRFIRKYGYDAISKLVPESDIIMHKRLRNIKKISERKKKLKYEDEEQSENDLFLVKNKPKSIEEILEELDSDGECEDSKEETVPKKKNKTWIQEDPDTIVDFTAATASRQIIASHPSSNNIVERKEPKKTNPFKTTSDGRLIITNDDDDSDDNDRRYVKKSSALQDSDSDDLDDSVSVAESSRVQQTRKRKLSGASDTASEPAAKYQAGGHGIHRPIVVAKPKTKAKPKSKKGPVAFTGVEYKAKKAKGDIKKKGLPDPYAYVPLSRKLLNKRKKVKQAGQFKNMVRAAHKGAKKGSKARMKNKF